MSSILRATEDERVVKQDPVTEEDEEDIVPEEDPLDQEDLLPEEDPITGEDIVIEGDPVNGDDPMTGALPFEERVRQRAHGLYLSRGTEPGSALEDWLRAEEEIRLEDRRQSAAS